MGEAETHLAPPEEYLRKKARDAQFYKRVKSARAHRKCFIAQINNTYNYLITIAINFR